MFQAQGSVPLQSRLGVSRAAFGRGRTKAGQHKRKGRVRWVGGITYDKILTQYI